MQEEMLKLFNFIKTKFIFNELSFLLIVEIDK